MGSSVWVILCVACLLLPSAFGYGDGEVLVVTWDNFTDIQQGEWMLEFYAPWCPACQQFEKEWISLARRTTDYDVKIAKVDITKQTMLSGMFMVTHLPSLYHINEGVVRFYEGERNVNDLMDYIREMMWKEVEPVPYWKSPTSKHMYAVGVLFWLSEWAKGMQEMLESQYNIPTYGVFIILAVATIIVGLTLGGITVCFIEVCIRCCSSSKKAGKQKKRHAQQKKEVDPKTVTEQPEVPPPSPKQQSEQQEASPVTEKQSPGEKAKGEGARKRKKKGDKGDKGDKEK